MDNNNNQGSFQNARVGMKLVSEKASKNGVMIMAMDPSLLSQISSSSCNKPNAKFRKNGLFSSMAGNVLGFHELVRDMTPVVAGLRKEKRAPKVEEQQEKEVASPTGGLVVAGLRKKREPVIYHLKDELPYHLKAERISAEYEQKNSQDDSAQISKDNIPTTSNINVSDCSDLQIELKYPTTELFTANTLSTPLSSDEAKLNEQLKAAHGGTPRDAATNSSQTSPSSSTSTKPTHTKQKCIPISELIRFNAELTQVCAEMRANAGLPPLDPTKKPKNPADTENRPKLRYAPHGYAAAEDLEEWYTDFYALMKEKKERLMGTR